MSSRARQGEGSAGGPSAISLCQEILERLIAHGKTVRLHINVQNKVTDGPVDSANVVGEIPGTQHPEQIIVVGGHLDSWDLAEGSTDDGVGVATTLGAAEAIVRSGFKPLRTIRFVLFTGDDLVSAASEFASTLNAFGKITANDATEFGTDAGPFILAGRPGINLDQGLARISLHPSFPGRHIRQSR